MARLLAAEQDGRRALPYTRVTLLQTYLVNPLLDLIFPAVCVGCGRVGAELCRTCQAEFPGLPLETPPPAPLAALAALGHFEGAVQNAVHGLKYDNLTSLARPLGAWLAEYATRLGWPASVIVPVPLHADRLAKRGYNQAALLGAAMAATLDWPWQPELLTRQRATASQVGLNYQERQANVKAAFVLTGQVELAANSHIILIDDVFTTGATIRACADVLTSAGARSVRALVVGRARSPGQS